MNHKKIIFFVLMCWVCTAFSDITAKKIPPGYHFPTPTSTIQQWIATADVKAMREHAWDIWSGMTVNSGEMYDGKELPIWETWYGFNDVFSSGQKNTSALTAASFLASHRGPLRVFIQPHQFKHVKTGLPMIKVLGPMTSRLMSFNKFSPDAAAFIISPQTGPGSQTYRYNSGSSLKQLNNAWPVDTRGEDRTINQLPVESLVAKPVFSIVKPKKLTPLPLWQGPAASTQPVNPTSNTWTTCVLIDPNGKGNSIRPATKSEINNANEANGLSCKTFLYAPLSTLYSFKIDREEAAAFNKVRGGGVRPGDYAVLVAFHVNTREIPFWTWQTFYWQPGADTPDNFPGSKADQPKNLQTPWNNYAVCVNYNQTTTLGGNTMDVCFNPYLETTPGIPNGMSSNCMSCHGVARVSNEPLGNNIYPADYKAPIAFFSDPLYFNSSTTHTEFSWAIGVAP